jgi:diguanylate cyclase
VIGVQLMPLIVKFPLLIILFYFLLPGLLFVISYFSIGIEGINKYEYSIIIPYIYYVCSSVLLVLWVSKKYINPIIHLMKFVKEIENRNLINPPYLRRNDEIGQLSKGIHFFTERMVQYQNEIEVQQDIIQYLENHDPLTGLANRHAIKNHLDVIYDRSKDNGSEIAFIYVEIDRFKQVNDTLGHLKGDLLLQSIAQRIKKIVPHGALVGRQGGDEFIIIMEGLKLEIVKSYVEKILASFQEPFELEGIQLYAHPSIGMSLFPLHTNKLSTLVTFADIAMYTAKELGGNRIVIYSEYMNKLSEEQIQMEGRLYRAIENGDIEVFYQPQVNALTNQIIGAEALVRWNDEKLGYIPPNIFIPIAEENGLIQKIWEIVMEDACSNLVQWNSQLETPIKVAVNLSAKQFVEPNQLITNIIDICSKHDMEPGWLEVEITESILLNNTEMTTKALKQFKEIGIEISVDDFGTGFSSLSYLRDFPISKLKIDQSFISDIDGELSNSEIALAIINLASSLKLGVIAEGVEQEYQKEFLVRNHCYEMQGYLFSKPVPSHVFGSLLGTNHSLKA